MLAQIDADICLHRVCFASENEDFSIVKARFDEMIDKILVNTNSDEYQLWISDSKENNFRYKIWDQYKANRTQPKPVWFEELKEYSITQWGAKIAYGMEADDFLGIEQCKLNNPEYKMDFNLGDKPMWLRESETHSIICTIDKDLNQIAGRHYNFVKEEEFFITPEDALKYFYTSLLVGDTADNIPGAPGIGPVKAAKALIGINEDWELWNEVCNTYKYAWQKKGMKEDWHMVLLSGQLLKIRTTEDENLWQPPSPRSGQTEVNGQSFTQQMVEEKDQYTELTGLGSLMGG